MMKLLIFFIALQAPAAETKFLNAEADAACRKTAEFKALCTVCLSSNPAKGAKCAGDIANHGNSPEFEKLKDGIQDFLLACGFKIPEDATVFGLGQHLVPVCRGEERVPDVNTMYKLAPAK